MLSTQPILFFDALYFSLATFVRTVINYVKNAAAITTTSTNYNRSTIKMTIKLSSCNVPVILGKTIRQYASCRITDQKESLSLHYMMRMSSEYLTCCLVSSIILLMMFPCFRSVHFQNRENIFHFPNFCKCIFVRPKCQVD